MAAKKAAKKRPAKKASRARTGSKPRSTKAPPVKERIQHIFELMVDGLWVRGVSGPPLAKEWGLEVNTVEKHASEASRMVRAAFADADLGEIRARLLANAEASRARSVRAGEEKNVQGAIKLIAEISGARAPVQIEAAVTLDELLGDLFKVDQDDPCEMGATSESDD